MGSGLAGEFLEVGQGVHGEIPPDGVDAGDRAAAGDEEVLLQRRGRSGRIGR